MMHSIKATAGILVAAVCLIGQAPPAMARGVLSKNGVALDGAKQCPDGWLQGTTLTDIKALRSRCYPDGPDATKVYRARKGVPCAPNYGLQANEWCVEAYVASVEPERP